MKDDLTSAVLSASNDVFRLAMEAAVVAFCDANGIPNWQGVPADTPAYYLGGPMAGIPGFNFPEFDAAALDLRRRGYLILSPAEMDDPVEREHALASPDGATSNSSVRRCDCLKRDYYIVLEADGMIVIDGWKGSEGARHETMICYDMDKPVFRYPGLEAIPKSEHPYVCYSTALRHIKDDLGGVCSSYDVCDHRSCDHSYSAWATADEALGRARGLDVAFG